MIKMTKITIDIFKKDMEDHPYDIDRNRAKRLNTNVTEIYYYRKIFGYPIAQKNKIDMNKLKKDIEKDPCCFLLERAGRFNISPFTMSKAEQKLGYHRKRTTICVKTQEK